jgi:hypothetical protein
MGPVIVFRNLLTMLIECHPDTRVYNPAKLANDFIAGFWTYCISELELGKPMSFLCGYSQRFLNEREVFPSASTNMCLLVGSAAYVEIPAEDGLSAVPDMMAVFLGQRRQFFRRGECFVTVEGGVENVEALTCHAVYSLSTNTRKRALGAGEGENKSSPQDICLIRG